MLSYPPGKNTTAIGETSQGGRQHRQSFYLMEFKFIYSGSSYKAPAMYRWEDIFEQSRYETDEHVQPPENCNDKVDWLLTVLFMQSLAA